MTVFEHSFNGSEPKQNITLKVRPSVSQSVDRRCPFFTSPPPLIVRYSLAKEENIKFGYYWRAEDLAANSVVESH